MEEFRQHVFPERLKLKKQLDLPEGMSEKDAIDKLQSIAKKNQIFTNYHGEGYYDTITPIVLLKNILENPSWYTPYTPYQSEISQGRLECLFHYQTMISELTDLPISNASLWDEGTAAAESMCIAWNYHKRNRNKIFYIASDCHIRTIEILKVRAYSLNIPIKVATMDEVMKNSSDAFGYLFQYPNTYGAFMESSYKDMITNLKAQRSTSIDKIDPVVILATDLLALTKIITPGECGADIAIGSTQRFGLPYFYGGPHAGFIACQKQYMRCLPGRIVGLSVDSKSNAAYRMAIQTREQHIRKEKATSNICTSQNLLAIVSFFYAAYHGPKGLEDIANRIHTLTSFLAAMFTLCTSYRPVSSRFIDTLHIDLKEDIASKIIEKAEKHKINLRHIDSRHVGISIGESTQISDLRFLMTNVFDARQISLENSDLRNLASQIHRDSFPPHLVRQSSYLTQDVFNSCQTELSLSRYIKSLEYKDMSLVTGMIPLGSCTMKSNPTAAVMASSWAEFSNIHPFSPSSQTIGYNQMINDVRHWFREITGFDHISLQPNSGAQSEYAGLLSIRLYHESRNEKHRNVCFIPVSAHGTNFSSAAMVGMTIVKIKTNKNGYIDMNDLKVQIETYKDRLACMMITYPSTYGIFEENIQDATQLIHDNGGQVYMDGANMNALVSQIRARDIGVDICHINLHKTFGIPHGGGGPGQGALCASSHLKSYLPDRKVHLDSMLKERLSISSSRYGNAGLLPITWMYLNLLGRNGLELSTLYALLHANYMKKILSSAYSIVYENNKNKYCAHEFIIDISPFHNIGITEEDISKRLQDYGFHSPTISWPIHGTLMIEPTESESLEQMTEFCNALLSIRQEIQEIQDEKITVSQSPLKHAPHTMVDLCHWNYPYSIQKGCFPSSQSQTKSTQSVYASRSSPPMKLWPSVNRVDNFYGDRNFICRAPYER